MESIQTFKPDFSSFVLFPQIRVIAKIFVALFLVSLVALPHIQIWLVFFFLTLGIGFVVLLVTFFLRKIEYDKTMYTLNPTSFLCKTGTLFSENQTELEIKNITQVTLQLPYIRNMFFQTGILALQSAGTGGTVVLLSDIKQSEDLYRQIESLMQKNGFGLQKKNLITQIRPNSLGVFFETFRHFLGSIFSTFFIILLFFEDRWDLFVTYATVSVTIIVLIFGYLFVRAMLQFLDLRLRTYQIYDDTIMYSDGFLTRNSSFIALENLSDTSIKQTLIDKIFGLYDVVLSSKGSNNQIVFSNMQNGLEVEKSLDSIIANYNAQDSVKKQGRLAENDDLLVDGKKTSASKNASTRTSASASYTHKKTQSTTNDIVYELTPNLEAVIKKTLVYNLPLILAIITIPFVLFFLLFAFIRAKFTKYVIKQQSIESIYNFLHRDQTEYVDEKVTGVIIHQSFVDKWFQTCSITFWSVGSAQKMIFQTVDLKYATIIQERFNFIVKPSDEVIPAQFSFVNFFGAKLIFFLLVIFIGIVLGLVSMFLPWLIIPIVGIFVMCILFYFYQAQIFARTQLILAKRFICYKTGWLVETTYFSNNDSIKNITSTKYIGTNVGHLCYDVAGEQVMKTESSASYISNTIEAQYIPNPFELHDRFDMEQTSIKSIQELYTTKKALGNALVVLFGISIILFPALFLLPITIPLAILHVKNVRYSVQNIRSVQKFGIFYKSQVSVLHQKIDHISKKQDFLNKLFNNGTVTINTVGSSTTELNLNDMVDYEQVYNEIKKNK